MQSLERIFEIVRKEFLQVLRDPRLVRVIIVAPLLQLMMFGYAVSTDVRNVATFVVDHDHSMASRELVTAFTASGYFRVVGASSRPADVVTWLDRGDAMAGLVIPVGFAADLAAGRARAQLLLDGSDSNTATVARGYAEVIVQNFAAAHASGTRLALELRERAWFNPDLSSRDYNVPAVIGAIILLVSLLLTSLAVVREREIGTLEQLMVSPLTAGELIMGKTLPFALISLLDLALVFALALWWFKVPFVGSLGVLLLASVLYLMGTLGTGLLISTVSRTQQEAFMTSFLVFMPLLLLSGFMFPVASMPEPFQWLTLANPLRHYLEIVRGVFLKGAGLNALWPQFLYLLGMGVGLLWFASTRFSKTAS
ncbi:MAG: ABC transporter permease [Burkholderiaceae bacterium]